MGEFKPHRKWLPEMITITYKEISKIGIKFHENGKSLHDIAIFLTKSNMKNSEGFFARDKALEQVARN